MTFPDANENEKIRGVYTEIAKVFAKVPVAYQALALRPDIFEQFWGLAKRIIESGVIGWSSKLMIALDVAATDGCTTSSGDIGRC